MRTEVRSVLLKPPDSEKIGNLHMYCNVVQNIFCMFPTGISKRMLEDVLFQEKKMQRKPSKTNVESKCKYTRGNPLFSRIGL